ncbi:MAG: 8-amino-7-oxononanoate synthase [Proteobacteria bacterium]|nr:8-amino-7-oxononanoate synthase [Pseudomonadota bacterium]
MRRPCPPPAAPPGARRRPPDRGALHAPSAKRGLPALGTALSELAAAQLRRERRVVHVSAAQGRGLRTAAGAQLVDFSSNDYLGLARHPALAEAMAGCARQRGAGSGASHLVTGHGAEHEALEAELAAFTGRERALLFSTGYMANLAVLASLAGRGTGILLDRLSHASLLDGARLAGARLTRFAHANADDAARRAGEATRLIGTDGVFSMDGDLAPLPQLAELARARDAWLVVDDAHGLGVVGPGGRGTLAHFGLGSAEVPVLVGTLGKAFGSFGAFVAGDATLIEFLVQKARPYIYTTALPQPVAAASRAALRLLVTEPERQARLQGNIARFRTRAAEAGIALTPSATPIQPVVLGTSAAALAAQRQLAARGYCVMAIRPPTVPAGSARLRITLAATHTPAEIDGLIAALAAALPP